MALQVWLPFLGNTNNQGIADTSVSVPSGISYIDGKIGKCVSISANNSINITVPNLSSMLANGKTYSLSCWVKLTNNTENGWVIKLGSNACGLWWANSEARWVWNENDNGKRCANPTISGDYTNWHHLVTVVDKTVTNTITAKHYVDGSPATSYEVQTWDNSTHSQPTGDIIYIYPYISLLNDVKLYDHALSEKEIKELSKGLTIHYPFNDFVGNSNIFKLDSISTSTSNTTLTTSGNTIRLTTTSGVYCGFGAERMDFVAGTSYTVSCHIKAFTKDPNWNPRISIRNSSNAIQASASLNSGNEADLSFTYTPSATITDGYVSGIITGGTATSADAEFSNVKCEIGTKVTPYIPHTTDALYKAGGFNSNVVLDTSGYNYNGTMSSTKPTVYTDSPKYNCCMNFVNDAYIQTTTPIGNIYTFAWWGNLNNVASKMMWGYSNGNRLNLFITGGKFYLNTGDGSDNPFSTIDSSIYADNNWHHFAITSDGTTVKLYIDGAFKANATSFKGIMGTTLVFNGWNTSTDYDFNGKLSDFRLYMSCLSAADVSELYNKPMSIDNTGKVYALEYREV